MAEYCLNYDSGEYEFIEENGFSWDQGDFVYNWDDSVYDRDDDQDGGMGGGSGFSLFDDDDDDY